MKYYIGHTNEIYYRVDNIIYDAVYPSYYNAVTRLRDTTSNWYRPVNDVFGMIIDETIELIKSYPEIHITSQLRHSKNIICIKYKHITIEANDDNITVWHLIEKRKAGFFQALNNELHNHVISYAAYTGIEDILLRRDR